jgi:enoyl-CoA hydratase/carnithine racemase
VGTQIEMTALIEDFKVSEPRFDNQGETMNYDFDYDVDDGIATITLNRPDVLNALTFNIYGQLRDLMALMKSDADVRSVIITGEGKGFCSGGDVHDIIGPLFEMDVKGHLEFTRMTGELIANMRLLDKPIIAAVNGTAAGAGAVIALASDLRIFSSRARIAFLFTKVGLTGADMGAAYLLPRIVGQSRATEALMLGDPIDAATAENWGLANRVVEPDELMTAANDWARRLADGPGMALSMTKRMINNEWNMDLLSAIEAEAQAQALLLMGDDHRIFFDAFRERVEPKFTGR